MTARYAARAVMLYRPLPTELITSWRFLRHGVHGSGRDMGTLVCSALAAVFLSLLVPIATGQVLGTLVPSAQSSLIIQLCVALLIASVVSAAFGIIQNLALLRVEGRFESILQSAVWDRLLRLPTAFFKRYGTGELASIALGVGSIRAALMNVSATVAYSAIVVLLNFIALFWFSMPLALLATVLISIWATVFIFLGSRQMKWQTRSIQIGYKLADQVFQILRGLPKLRVADATDRAFANWAGKYAGQKEIQKRAGRYQNIVTVFNSTYPLLCTLIIFAAIAGPVRGSLSPTSYLAFNSSFAIMFAAVIQVANSINATINVIPIFNRLKPILTEPLEVAPKTTSPGELSGDIAVNHLSFSYTKDGPLVLDDISFHARPGELIAIVGPSGCGKSTLLRLLLGFERPLGGTVLYDGQDLESMDVAAVRRQFGVVLQQAKPFSGSILAAITGGYNFTLDDAWKAAEMAGLSDDIAAMPMGMHTVITDMNTISGGQRQRIIIANALIRRPRILFFDEATSALDNMTQRIVTESTQRLNATRIVIAHRLSTVMDADQIIVLNSGRVAQQGSPAELLAETDGMFYRLVKRQIQQPLSRPL
jgi:NHLM bacteriocin system ABC transporter ATP-binding protein